MAIRDLYHDAESIARYVRDGEWADRTLDDYLQTHARERGDKLAIVDRRWRLTYRELNRLAHRAACGLLHLGVGPGDVISIQLPNWAEWLIVHCAATKIGAVTNSIGAVYREHEVGYILDYAATSLMVIPDGFRGFSYTDMVAGLRSKLPALRGVLVAGDRVPPGMRSFAGFLDTAWEAACQPDNRAARRATADSSGAFRSDVSASSQGGDESPSPGFVKLAPEVRNHLAVGDRVPAHSTSA